MRIFYGFVGVIAAGVLSLPAKAFNQKDAEDCQKASDPGQKIEACTRLLKDGNLTNQNSAIFLGNRGTGWIAKREFDIAIADFNEAIRLDPKNASLYRFRGIAWDRKGESDRAITDFNEAIRLDPKSAFGYSNRGIAWKNKGEFDRAIADFNAAIAINPKSDVTYYLRGYTWWNKSEFDRAINDFNEAIRLNPKNADAYSWRGNTWMNKGEFDRAIADINEAIRLNPQSSVAYFLRGDAWWNKHEPDRAIADLNEAIRLNPTDAAIYNRRGLCWIDKGDFDRAIADFNEAIRLNPRHSLAYAHRGEVWRLKGDLDRALVDQDEAVKMAPMSSVVYIRRADTLRYKGEFERALADYHEILRIRPDDIAAFTGRGLTFERMGDVVRARAEFEKALASLSQYREALHSRALETARDHLAALNSGAVAPVIPAAPSKVTSATSIPTPKLDIKTAVPIAPAQGHRVALVIGNSAYKSVAALPNPQHDADAVAAVLRAIGFETVMLVEDATRENLTEAVHTFAAAAEKADWALIYYGGHGIEANGINYLIPVDAKLASARDIQKEAVPLDDIMAAVEGAKKLKLVLLDACRDNPFAPQIQRTVAPDVTASRSSTAGATITTRSIGRGLGEVKVAGATLVVYAAKHGQIALDGEGANSPFAIALVQRLATPGVDITRIFRLVRDDVMEATAGRQDPFTYGSLPGREDFFFVAK